MEHIFFPVAFSFLSGFIIAYNIFHKKSVSKEEKAKIQLQREEQIKFDEEQKALLKEEKELNKEFTNN